jgi:hypothetical protein
LNSVFLIYFLSVVLLAAGFYFILARLLHLPTMATTRAAWNLSRYRGTKTKWTEALLLSISAKVGELFPMDDLKKRKLSVTLTAADIAISPETWNARCYVKLALLLLATIPMLWMIPMSVPVLIALAVRQLFTDLKAADKLLMKKKKEVERDLPRFVATVAQEIRNTKNVLVILEGYLNSARPAFRRELEITIADMKSGSQETALIRAKARIGSTMVDKAFDGLQSVLRGDDSTVYFDMLAHDYDGYEIQQLKLENAKIPSKVYACGGAMFVCFILLVFLILAMTIGQSYSSMNM